MKSVNRSNANMPIYILHDDDIILYALTPGPLLIANMFYHHLTLNISVLFLFEVFQ